MTVLFDMHASVSILPRPVRRSYEIPAPSCLGLLTLRDSRIWMNEPGKCGMFVSRSHHVYVFPSPCVLFVGCSNFGNNHVAALTRPGFFFIHSVGHHAPGILYQGRPQASFPVLDLFEAHLSFAEGTLCSVFSTLTRTVIAPSKAFRIMLLVHPCLYPCARHKT